MRHLISILFASIALTGCLDVPLDGLDPIGGEPAVECAGALCLADAQIEYLAATRSALETCTPAEQDAFMAGPDGLRLGGLDLVESPDGWTLVASMTNIAPDGFYGYPGMVVEVLDGDLAIETRAGVRGEVQMSPRHHEPTYGIAGCDEYAFQFPLRAVVDAPAGATLRVGITHRFDQPLIDEMVVELAL